MRALAIVSLLTATSGALADVRGPTEDAPAMRYVYPAAASADAIEKLYRDDLKALRDETEKLKKTDGGTLSEDHRTYLALRQTAIDRRYAEARGGGASTN